MESSEIGQKMRETFEATLPSDEAILRRYGHLRGLRAGEDLPGATRLRPAARRRPTARTFAVVAGGLLAAASILLLWGVSTDRPVAIGPSLERDLVNRRERVSVTEPSPRGEEAGDPRERATGSAQTAQTARSSRPAGIRPEEPAQPAPALQASAATAASWARVTEAMRQRDWAAAQVALGPMLESSDRETKDSARLVRVRLELGAAKGNSPEERWLSELEDLEKNGASSSIRASARRLLDSTRNGETKLAPPSEEAPLAEE